MVKFLMDKCGQQKLNQRMLFANYRFFVALWLLLISFFVTGCGVTLSPVKRASLQIATPKISLTPNYQTIAVHFENTLPDKPLIETVWDNVTGPFADAEESKQIGFTQDYSKLIPATALGGVGAGIAVGTQPDYTRIVIPFGRIFEGVFQSGLTNAFPNSSVSKAISAKYVVRLKVSEFQVWENPLNHLNLKAVVECKLDSLNEPEFVSESTNQITNQSIGSMMTTSSGFIRNMNKISNDFAASLSEDILKKLQSRIQDTSNR